MPSFTATRQGGQCGPEAPPWSADLQAAASALLGVAAALYLLRCLPAFLFPAGLASVLTLLLGFLLGIASVFVAVALAIYYLTLPGKLKDVIEQLLRPSKPPHEPKQHVHELEQPSSHEQTSARSVLPHPVAASGSYSGLVYTITASDWPATAVVQEWPPTSDPGKPFLVWNAAVSQGTLVLNPVSPALLAHLTSSSKHKAAAAAKAAAEAAKRQAAEGDSPRPETPGARLLPPPPQSKTGIPLEGCSVELVTDGLGGRSDLIRRAPLRISHPQWNLLGGERSFYLFAEEPAAKQQWLHALSWWCEGRQRIRAIEALYHAYCAAQRDRTCLDYAQVQQEGSQAGGLAGSSDQEGDGGEEGQQRRRHGWRRWGQGIRRRLHDRRKGKDSRDGRDAAAAAADTDALAAPDRSGGSAHAVQGAFHARGSSADNLARALPAGRVAPSLPRPVPASAAAAGSGGSASSSAQQLESLDKILEARWMQSTKIPVPIDPKRASRHSSPSQSAKMHPSDAAELRDGSSGGRSSGYTTPLLGSSPPGEPALGIAAAAAAAPGIRVARIGSSPARVFAGPAASAAASLHSTPVAKRAATSLPGSPTRGSTAAVDEAPGAEAGGTAAGSEAGAVPEEQVAAAHAAPGVPTHLPPGLPPLLTADQAVNAFITRLAFDALRSPACQEYVRSRIQRQLDRLPKPDYVHELTVVSVDLGSAAPTLRNLAALPLPGDPIWPQLLFDVRYEGEFSVLLETKVDIRDAAAWDKFEHVLTRMEGTAGPSQQQARRTARSGSKEEQQQEDDEAEEGVLLSSGTPAVSDDDEEEEEEVGGRDGGPPPQASPRGTELHGQTGAASPSAMPAAGAAAGSQGGGHRRPFMQGLRKAAVRKVRQMAENTASHIKRTPLRLRLTFSLLEGTMAVFVPPPPGNRLFYTFVLPPRVSVVARPEHIAQTFILPLDASIKKGGGNFQALAPLLHFDILRLHSLAELAHQGGSGLLHKSNHRLLKSSMTVSRASAWIEQRVRASISKNTVYPGCGDIILPLLMDLHHGNAADSVQGLLPYLQLLAQQSHRRTGSSSADVSSAAAETLASAHASPERKQPLGAPAQAAPTSELGSPESQRSLASPAGAVPACGPAGRSTGGCSPAGAGAAAAGAACEPGQDPGHMQPQQQQLQQQLQQQQSQQQHQPQQQQQDSLGGGARRRISLQQGDANAPAGPAHPTVAAQQAPRAHHPLTAETSLEGPASSTAVSQEGGDLRVEDSSASGAGSEAGHLLMHFDSNSSTSMDSSLSTLGLRRTTSGRTDGSAAAIFAAAVERQQQQQQPPLQARGDAPTGAAPAAAQRQAASQKVGAQISSSLSRLKQQARVGGEQLRSKSGTLLSRLASAGGRPQQQQPDEPGAAAARGSVREG